MRRADRAPDVARRERVIDEDRNVARDRRVARQRLDPHRIGRRHSVRFVEIDVRDIDGVGAREPVPFRDGG